MPRPQSKAGDSDDDVEVVHEQAAPAPKLGASAGGGEQGVLVKDILAAERGLKVGWGLGHARRSSGMGVGWGLDERVGCWLVVAWCCVCVVLVSCWLSTSWRRKRASGGG